MSYKILYIEDLPTGSIQNDLERCGFEVAVNNADDFNDTLSDIVDNEYDAFIMDFRLTANTGRVDAPTFASTIRTNGGNHKKCPIILISSEENLPEFNNDFTSQDLFDMVISKTKLRTCCQKYSKIIIDLIESYRSIILESYNTTKLLNIENTDYLDYRLIEILDTFSKQKNPYGYCRTIFYSLIRSIGILVGEDVLAARLGIEKSCEDFNILKEKLESCKYRGILSKAYDRWWFDQILAMWKEISGGKSLRRMKAADRVDIINNFWSLHLQPAKPIKFASSSTFWTICSKELKPLDPNEGYIYNNKVIDVWQEPEYISLYSALEYPELREKLSPMDRKEIFEIGKNARV